MAQLVVAAAGAAIGGMIAPGIVAFGMTGASIGWMAGSMIGSAFAPTQKSSGPQLSDLSVSTSAYGTPIPYVQGHPRIAGQIVWASTKREIATTTEQGKGGGGAEYTSYTYEVDLLILLTDNQIAGVARIWSNGELVYDGIAKDGLWVRMTPYTGAASQLPDPTYEAAVGTANAPAYRGRGSVFIQSLQLGGSGQIPNLTFEIGVAGYAYAAPFTVATFTRSMQHHDYTTSAMHSSLIDGSMVVFTSGGGLYVDSTTTSYRINTDGSETLLGSVLNTATNGPFNGTHMSGWSDAPILGTSSNAGVLRLHNGVCGFIKDVAIPGIDATDQTKQYFKRGAYEYVLAESASTVIYRIIGTTASIDFSSTARGSVHTMFPGDEINYTFSETQQLTAYTKEWIELWNVDMSTFGISVTRAVGGSDAVLFEESSGRVLLSYGSNFYIITQAGVVSIGSAIRTMPYERHGGVSYFDGVWYEVRTNINPGQIYKIPLNRTSVVTVSPAALVSVVNSLCALSGLQPAQYNTTALASISRPVRSMAISSVSSARTVLDMLASSYHFEAVLSDKIYFRPRATAPAATLTFNELGVVVDSGSTPEPLPLTQANELEIPAQMALTYSNVDGDYQTDTQYSDRLLTGQESTSAMTLPLGFTSSEAKQIVDAMLLDKAISALTTSVSLGLTRAALEPTDVVLLTGEDGSSYRMRIVKKAEASGVTTLECVQDDSTVFTQTGTTAGGAASQTTVLATPTTTLELLDVPLLRDVDNLPGHYVAVKGSAANWTSCGLYDSLDDLTYTPNTTISSQAVIGTCTTTLATWAGGNVFDEVSSVTVNVGTQQLSSVTRDDILASQSTNAALIGGEVLQYRTATLVSSGVYTLGGFLRGQRGTVSTGHVAAERFIVLASGGLRFVPLQQGDLGRVRYYKAASAGQRLSAVTSQSLTPAGITLKPFAPVNARANRNAADTVLTWTRQTRLSTRIVGTLGISSPLGEAAEVYEVEIYTAGHAALLRTLTSATPTVTYTSAQQVTDFGSNQTALAVKIYQISATVGRGTPLTTTV